MEGERGEWLAVGRVRRPHGIHGDVVADIETDFPERIVAGMEVGVGDDAPERRLTLDNVRLHKGGWLLSFLGISTVEEAETLRDRWLFLPEQGRAELPENFYYDHELVGARCRLPDGRDVGVVTEVVHGPGNALLSVRRPDGGEGLVPFVSPIVVRVDSVAGEVVIDPPAGLLDEDAPL